VYARVNTFDGSTERFDVATDYIRQLVIPASRQMPGFAGMISLVDRETGRSMGITLWDSIESLDASEEAANYIRNQTTESGEAALVSIQRFEVADLTIEPRP
jgi:hypothetical protein